MSKIKNNKNGVLDEGIPIEPDVFKEAEKASLEVQSKEKELDDSEVDIDLGDTNIAEAENKYREEVERNKGQTRVITNTVVKEVIRTVPAGKSKNDSVEDNREKTEEEEMVGNIAAVINNHASTKLDKYERKRKNNILRKRLWFCVKVIVIIAIGVTLYRNDVVREKVAIISADVVDLVTRIKNNDEDKSSNKLVEDALNMMGTNLDEVGEKCIDLLDTETEN